jgi:hypothetical protein
MSLSQGYLDAFQYLVRLASIPQTFAKAPTREERVALRAIAHCLMSKKI